MDSVKSGRRRFEWLTAAGMVMTFVMSGVALTQELRVPDPRLPRTPDGKPSLSAPVPRTPDGKPDLSGIWRAVSDKYLTNLAADGIQTPFQPGAAALYKKRQANKGKDRPSERCLPRGVPSAMLVRDRPWKIVQTPGLIMILHDESLHYRQIFTDGRNVPEDPASTWFGYAIAKWDGDTLVAETTGLSDETWLDDGGRPHTEALRVTERFRRRTVGAMDIEITIDDPKAYTRPWTATVRFELLPDTDLNEHVCAINSTP